MPMENETAPLEAAAQAIFRAGLAAVRPDVLVARAMEAAPPEPSGRTVVVGAGKAALPMAGAVERGRSPEGVDGLVVVPHGYRETLPQSLPRPRRIAVAEAGHPLPDAAGVRAARRVLDLVASCGAGDRVLVLLSGGASALWTLPADGLTLEDLRRVHTALMQAGVPIAGMNAVRKHLGRLGGGQLARAAAPARVQALVLSDVPGDDPAVIGSGPTAPDPSTFGEVMDLLAQYGLTPHLPKRVAAYLTRGVGGAVPETPGPGDPAFEHVETVLVGHNRLALSAARAAAERLGFAARVVSAGVTGEARTVARDLIRQARDVPPGPRCLLWGGETTVTVTGPGRGGRNQELALAAALALDGWDRPAVFLSVGTDGIDGPTDAAGALVTPRTCTRARAMGLDPRAFLEANDAHGFFDAVGGILRTGPTHTNVMDLQVLVLA